MDSFVSLKNSLCVSVCLCIPQPSDKFVLETDASGTGVGAVLSVVRHGELLPVRFYSRQLHGAEEIYSSQELECLAIYSGSNHFSFYLFNTEFEVWTDHKSLCSMMKEP